tara:strand:+ start:1309 stop:1728 length:420 start_codon:yes stop_codon:yes gene_type:complete
MIKDIYEFNTEILEVKRKGPKLLEEVEINWLIGALREEIQELIDANEIKDLVGCVDGVLDLAYFAVGACVRMGLTKNQIEDCFQVIHTANMAKRKGIKESRPQDGSIADAVKPIEWEPPELAMAKIIFKNTKQIELDFS